MANRLTFLPTDLLTDRHVQINIHGLFRKCGIIKQTKGPERPKVSPATYALFEDGCKLDG
ncbi:hypothetical protein DPMN_122560 [Dreissena polymorpha]|uniref:Uncharacterized protein n=1 Tax=Dreissena polymorpha TaxID=45954 RepID=A0A9D4GST2_DREPO|nr:hypothetical protein DPMN_122560 [Dreissena polymorpha]